MHHIVLGFSLFLWSHKPTRVFTKDSGAKIRGLGFYILSDQLRWSWKSSSQSLSIPRGSGSEELVQLLKPPALKSDSNKYLSCMFYLTPALSAP